MAWFGSRNKQGTRGTPGEQYNRNNNPVIHRPADAPPAEVPAAPAPVKEQPAQTPEQEFLQKLMERGLSQISLKYEEMPILILHEIDPGKAPQRIEKVIERWYNLPGGSRFDVLSFKRHFYCISRETGQVDMSIELPDDYAKMAQKEQDKKVREFMTELTGEKPAAPVAGTLTELLNAMSDDELYDFFYDMEQKERQRILNAAHKALRKRQQEAGQSNQRRQQSGGGEGGEGKKPEQPAQRQQPVRQPASQATGLGAVRRRRGG